MVFVSEADAARMGIADGDFVRVTSRRGSIELAAKVSHRETPGSCFIPFHFREAAANLLTIDEIDPFGKIPEFKFCAVRIETTGPRDRSTLPDRRAGAAGSGLMSRGNGRVPGVEARAGQVPGPVADPAADGDPARARLAAARAAREALARLAPAAVRDRRARSRSTRTSGPRRPSRSRSPSAATSRAGCRASAPRSPKARRSTRSPASGAATRRRSRSSRSATRRSRRGEGRRPNDPYDERGRALPRLPRVRPATRCPCSTSPA